MGTAVSIQAYHPDRANLQHAISMAFDELYRFDRLFSIFNSESDISKINQSAGTRDVSVHRETVEILKHAVNFSKSTGGTFDCTVEPLMRVWGFRDKRITSIPTEAEIRKSLLSVGYKNIVIDEHASRAGLVYSSSSIDLGGMAVGYTLDRMVSILRREGIESALINHSGDISAIGTPPDSYGWQIGIPSPFHQDDLISEFTINDQSVSTSGSYEKFVAIGDKRFGHLINCQSGTPATENAGITVISDSSLLSDVLSTTLFCDVTALSRIESLPRSSQILRIDQQGVLTNLSY